MDHVELNQAYGRRVRVTAGIQKAEGVLSGWRQSEMEVGAWGGSMTRPGNEYFIVLDGQEHEFPLGAELEVLD